MMDAKWLFSIRYDLRVIIDQCLVYFLQGENLIDNRLEESSPLKVRTHNEKSSSNLYIKHIIRISICWVSGFCNDGLVASF